LKNWKALVIAQRGEYSQRLKSARHTSASECSSWPTVSASSDAAGTPDGKMQWMLSQAARTGCATRQEYKTHGQAAPANPSINGSRPASWATPNVPNGGRAPAVPMSMTGMKEDGAKGQVDLNRQVRHWATPQAGASTAGSSDFTRSMDVALGYRSANNAPRMPTSAMLNPRWVETLMGLPVGWTMPSCTSPVTIAPTSCGSLAMA